MPDILQLICLLCENASKQLAMGNHGTVRDILSNMQRACDCYVTLSKAEVKAHGT